MGPKPVLVLEVIPLHVQDFVFPFDKHHEFLPAIAAACSDTSEWQHNPLQYQPLLPVFYHLQSKFQTQINIMWITKEQK